jgi:c-di-GMP-binding flagellar brake protein YcgR
MVLGELKVGKQLEIFIKRDGYSYRIKSKIEEAVDGRVCVSLIASGKHVFEFLKTDVVDIVYQNDDRMWKWANVKGGFTDIKGEMFHCFETDEDGELYNRRNAFRVNMNQLVTIQYKAVEKSENDEEDDENHSDLAKRLGLDIDSALEACYNIKSYEVLARDISEDGFGFYTNELFSINDEIAFEFDSSVGTIRCEGVIFRFFESRHSLYQYYYGCRFTETNRTLIKYVYEMQRQEIRKAKEGLNNK